MRATIAPLYRGKKYKAAAIATHMTSNSGKFKIRLIKSSLATKNIAAITRAVKIILGISSPLRFFVMN